MRYVIAGDADWTHIFAVEDDEVERHVRFAYDTDEHRLAVMEIERDGDWFPACRFEQDDLAESLVDANPDLLTDPTAYGLSASERLPEWVDTTPAPGG